MHRNGNYLILVVFSARSTMSRHRHVNIGFGGGLENLDLLSSVLKVRDLNVIHVMDAKCLHNAAFVVLHEVCPEASRKVEDH